MNDLTEAMQARLDRWRSKDSSPQMTLKQKETQEYLKKEKESWDQEVENNKKRIRRG